MKKLLIIGTGYNPSNQANSIQLLQQANTLLKYFDVKILCGFRNEDGLSEIENQYGLYFKDHHFLNTVFFRTKAISMQIGFISFIYYIFYSGNGTKVYSRNLYFSFLQALFRYEGVYEAHMLEKGIRRMLEWIIYNAPSMKVIAISDGLRRDILDRYHIRKSIAVLPDAAVAISQASSGVLRPVEKIGYFGSKIRGRGIDLIIQVANELPDLQFHIYGPGEIIAFESLPKNLNDEAHIPFRRVAEVMSECDVLLMPYQYQVAINRSPHNTVNWMSPLKMFDYMASGIPLISSDLPVLREVLTHKENCLLAGPESVHEWVNYIQELQRDSSLRDFLGRNAMNEIHEVYNWKVRASRIAREINA